MGRKFVLPLCLSGFTSYLPVCFLTENEWKQCETLCITLTNKHLTWDLNSTDYEDQENAMTDFRGKIVCKYPAAMISLMIIDQVTASTCTNAADFTFEEKFATMILSNVNANVSDISNPGTRYGNIKLQNTKQVDSETLAKRWNSDLGKSKKIVTRTV